MGGTYYEVMIKELFNKVKEIDTLRDNIVKIDKKLDPVKKVYSTQSSVLRKKVREKSKEYDSKHSKLWLLFSSKDYNPKQLNDYYKELNKIKESQYKVHNEYLAKKKEYNNKVKYDVIKKRDLNKQIPVLTETIFNRIRNR